MMPRIAFVTLVAAMIAVACAQEPNLNVFLEKKKAPATFSFSGRSTATDFEILELPRTKPVSKTNPFSFTGTTIWKISATESIKAANWPSIIYGQIPNGFSQTIPDHGTPPQFTADKLYVARILGDKDAETALFFEIRNGKPVNVSDEVLGP